MDTGIINLFSRFYCRHSEMTSKYNIDLNTLLQEGLSEPDFYGDLKYKFKKIDRRADFRNKLKKIVPRYKRIGYNCYSAKENH